MINTCTQSKCLPQKVFCEIVAADSVHIMIESDRPCNNVWRLVKTSSGQFMSYTTMNVQPSQIYLQAYELAWEILGKLILLPSFTNSF